MTPDLGAHALLVDLIDGLGAHVGQTIDLETVKRALHDAQGSPPEAQVASAARAAGLQVSRREARVSELPILLDSGLPVVIFATDGPVGLIGWQGREAERLPRTKGARPERLRPAALAELLGIGADAPVPMLLIDPSLPASPLASAGPSEGAHSPWRRILRLAMAERADVQAVVVTSLAVGLLTLVTPLVVQVLINNVALGALTQPIVVLAAILLICVGMAGGLRVLQRQIVEALQRRLFVRMVADLAQRLPRVAAGTFDQHYGPDLVNRFFDVLTVQKSAKSLLLDGVSAALQAVVGLALLAFYHPVLLAFSTVLIVVMLAIFIPLGWGATKTAATESKAKYAVASWLEELARNPLMFRTSAGAALALDRADSLARRYLSYRQDHFRIFMRQYGGTVALQAIAGAGLMLAGGALVIDRQLSLGQLVASEFVVTGVLAALLKFSEKLEVYYDLSAAVDKLGHLVELPVERADGATPAPPEGPADLQLHGLSFGYSPAAPCLRGLQLRLAPGETVLISGPSGSGKSTLGAILFGLRSPGRGEVLLDGEDLRALQPAHIRSQVTLAAGVEVLAGTIAENLTLGRLPLTGAALEEALEAVGLDGEVARLPAGLETVLSPTGAPLSSGAVRRLVVARAIAARPRLLIVDDVLDGLTELDQAMLLRALSPPDRPWSLLVLSRSAALPGLFDHRLALDGVGVLRAQPVGLKEAAQ